MTGTSDFGIPGPGTPGPGTPAPPRRIGAPAPLVIAALLVAAEAMLLLLVGVAQVAAIAGDRLPLGVTTAFFFLAYGVGLGLCALAMTRLRSWARSPIVLAQLIQIGVAWSFRDPPWTWAAVSLAAAALIVIAGVLHPASLEALREA